MINIGKKVAFYFEKLIWSLNQLVYYTLTIITIIEVGTFPLLNAFFIGKLCIV
jgi:hypothetical protein